MSSDPNSGTQPGFGVPVTPGRPEELPPVTPPSAGYIIQLFLIPALIVAAVVAVWALFGKLADSEADWKHMVQELGSSNEHERWRAAMGLAQLLRNDELAPVEGEVPLAEQPIVVDGLVSLLSASLDSQSSTDEDVRHQEFLARTLGTLRADDKVLPVLARAISPEYSSEVRKSSLMSVASIAGRHFEQATGYDAATDTTSITVSADSVPNQLPLDEPTITDPDVIDQLRQAAQDSDPVIRSLAAFALASVSGSESLEQLRVLLLDADANTRANAAIGLARNGLTDGVSALKELLKSSSQPFDPQSMSGKTPEEVRAAANQYEVEQPIIARNCLRAISSIWWQISADDQQELVQLVTRISEDHFAPDVRLQARELLKSLVVGTAP